MISKAGPIVLLADSQLLFSRKENNWLIPALENRLSGKASADEPKRFGVYIGASNGNEQVFYAMAKEALMGVGVSECLFLKTSLADLGDKAQQTPSVIVLSGGDVALGWQLLKQPSLRQWIDRCLASGTLLMGISAGAIHLTNAISEAKGQPNFTPCFNYYPAITLVHEEAEQWPSERLYEALRRQDQRIAKRCCLKIPFGSGVWIEGAHIATFGRSPSQLIQGDMTIDLKYEQQVS